MVALFEASKLKIRRARRHLDELEAQTLAFLARSPVQIVVEKWEVMPDYLDCHAWTARVREQIPPEFSAMIGDVIHNLRAALDLLACDLVRLNDKDPKDVYFPFAKNAADFDHLIRRRNMHKASDDVLKILRSLKPYRGGNEALRAIHDLDIQDKHSALIPTAQAAVTMPFGIKLGQKVNQVPAWSSIVTDGHKLLMMPAMDNVPLGTIIPSALRITFRPGDIFAGSEVVPTLHQLAELTGSAIQAFEMHFQRADKGPEN